MQKALLAGLLGGAACGMAGVFVVLMRISFIGVCIAHAAFAGALTATLLGLPPQAGGLALGMGAAASVRPLSRRASFNPDIATSIIFSFMLSLAMLVLGLLPGSRAEGLGLVWGSILTVTAADLWLLGMACGLSFVFILLFFKELQAVTCHPEAARAAGIAVEGITQGIFLLLGLIIAAGLKTIGGLLIYSLIVTPAAAAYQITYSLKRMFVLAGVFGVCACWGGLLLSAWTGLPSGAVIVLAGIAIFGVCLALGKKRRA